MTSFNAFVGKLKRRAKKKGARSMLDAQSLLGAHPRLVQWSQSLLSWRIMRRRAQLGHVTFVGVTGSCGKTTAVALSAAVLSAAGPCQRGMGSDPEKIARSLRIGPSTKFYVHELQANEPGKIAVGLRLIQPQIGIVTTIGDDHYANYRGREATAREKGQLVERLPPDGVAILNADDADVRAMAERTRARVITYGLGPDADLRATEVSSAWPNRLSLVVTHGGEIVRIETRLVGEHWVTSVLAAIACGIACGVDLKTCADALKTMEPVFGRYSVHVGPDGGAYVLDTRKAPFWTVAPGLAFVASARAPRKTMVFGTISDYPGARSPRYRRVAREALTAADRVVFVGPQSSHVDKLRRGEVRDSLFTFETAYQAATFLSAYRLPGELIYVKASSTDHLERLMLAELDEVVCWRERCGRSTQCPACRLYRVPKRPPLGLEPKEDSELETLS